MTASRDVLKSWKGGKKGERKADEKREENFLSFWKVKVIRDLWKDIFFLSYDEDENNFLFLINDWKITLQNCKGYFKWASSFEFEGKEKIWELPLKKCISQQKGYSN